MVESLGCGLKVNECRFFFLKKLFVFCFWKNRGGGDVKSLSIGVCFIRTYYEREILC